jgi:hypothetical protein
MVVTSHVNAFADGSLHLGQVCEEEAGPQHVVAIR